jgi:hypothetical protein
MMNLKNISNLKEIIEKQLEMLTKVLEIEKNKNVILVQGKLSDFSSMNNELSYLLPEIEKIENHRQVIIANFVEDNNESIQTSNISFLNILNLIKEEDVYDEMYNLYQNIKGIVDEIKHYTAINKDLIEVALNVLNLTLNENKKDIDYTGKSEDRTASVLVNRVI